MQRDMVVGVDEDALVEAAYEAHSTAVARYITHMTRDPDLAEELVQEAFLRLTIAVRQGSAPDDPRAWLYRVAGNLARSWFRHRRVARGCDAGGSLTTASLEPPEVPVRRERVAALESALGGLPERHRRAVVLAAHGMPGPEIGERLGMSSLATRSLLLRARRRLREHPLLAEYATA